jgi:uncharacterized membrane protein
MIVHFPVALIIVGFFAETVSLFFKSEKCLSRTGYYLLVIGTIAAMAAWFSGVVFTSRPYGNGVTEIFEKHTTGALITMILLITGSVFRIWLVRRGKEESPLKWVAFGLYLAGFISVSLTGLYGGIMVYNFMLPG